jgi:RING finger and CHY zinc finger domain-containing protein 1
MHFLYRPPKINNGGRYHRSASLPSSFVSMEQEDTHHTIDRFAIAEVICRQCFTRQSSKTNQCVTCHVQFGEYNCTTCNLWMSNEERPYHCEHCGFCRVGGAENFQHCHSCGMCIDISLIETHNCKEGKYRSNCPVCQEYLFSSRGASHEMPCGHAIHWECFRQLAAHDSRCPICKKTAETRERMMPTWNAMAASIAMQPIPPEMARVVSLTCNDCESTEDARAWHFLGMQCSKCQTFNTVVDRIHLTGEEAHEFLETNARIAAAHQLRQQQQQQQVNEHDDNPEGGHDEDPNRPIRRRVNRRRSAF